MHERPVGLFAPGSRADGYYRLCDHWLATTRYRIADTPTLEVHATRRNQQPADAVTFTIRSPLDQGA